MNFEKREVVNTRNYKKITELDVFKISNKSSSKHIRHRRK